MRLQGPEREVKEPRERERGLNEIGCKKCFEPNVMVIIASTFTLLFYPQTISLSPFTSLGQTIL